MHTTNLRGMDYSHFTDTQTAAQRIAQSHAAEEVLELGCEPRSIGPRSCSSSLYSTASAHLQHLEKN